MLLFTVTLLAMLMLFGRLFWYYGVLKSASMHGARIVAAGADVFDALGLGVEEFGEGGGAFGAGQFDRFRLAAAHPDTNAGRAILAQDPNCSGSLGLALPRAVFAQAGGTQPSNLPAALQGLAARGTVGRAAVIPPGMPPGIPPGIPPPANQTLNP